MMVERGDYVIVEDPTYVGALSAVGAVLCFLGNITQSETGFV